MKISKLVYTVVLAIVMMALASPHANAGPVTYTADDLFMCFRATGSPGATQDYVVNIGQASKFTSASSTGAVTGLGNIAADLVAVFGPNWHDRSDVFWSISGTPGSLSSAGGDTAKTLYASEIEPSPDTLSDAWLGGSSFGQGPVSNRMVALAQAYAYTLSVPNTSSTNSAVALIQNTSDTNSYASYTANGSSFGYFNPSIEGDFSNGTAGSILDLYRIPVGSGIPGSLVGTFQLNDSAVLTFTPASALVQNTVPAADSAAATGVTDQAATLNGSVNPGGLATSYYFEYGATTGYGLISGTLNLPAGTTAVSVSTPISGLNAESTYNFRLVASNNLGTVYGGNLTLTTGTATAAVTHAPTAVSGSTGDISTQGATLYGTLNPGGLSTDYYFEYGPTESLGMTSGTQTVVSGSNDVSVSSQLSGLTPGSLYHYRVAATNSRGTTTGGYQSFSTVAAVPIVTTGTASQVTYDSCLLNGSVDPNGFDVSDVHFEYGTTSSYGYSSGTTNAVAGIPVAVNAQLSGLTDGSTVHFRIVATSLQGTSLGQDGTAVIQSRKVPTVSLPSFSGTGQSIVTAATVTTPNGLSTKVHFSYGKTTAYGTNTADATLAASGSASNVSVKLVTLAPHTSYHLRAVATNFKGAVYSSDRSFRTLPRSDTNRDGFADLIAINPKTRATTVLFTKNGTKIGTAGGSAIASTLSFCGQADFDADGITDWVIDDTIAKRVQLWYANGTRKVLTPLSHPGLNLVAVEDMNGDGYPDLILVNPTTQQIFIWTLASPARLLTKVNGPLIPAGFAIVGADDLTGDGKADILLWNSATGATKVLQFNGTSLLTSYSGPVVPKGWQLAGVDAFNSDDSADWIVYNPATQQTQIWVVKGAVRQSSITGPAVPVGLILLGTK